MTETLELLQWLRAQLGFLWDVRPASPATTFVPTRAKLAASRALNTTFQSYRSEVLARFADLETRGVIAKLKNARSQAAAMSSAPALQPTPNLPGNTVSRFDDRLLLEVPAGDNPTTIGFGLASGVTDPASVTDKVTAIIQLRRVEDVLIRVLAAERAAALTSQPLPAILALYRAEGNLGVPPSASTLSRLIPSDAPNELTSVANFTPDSQDRRFWPHLVWLSKKSGVYGNFSFEYPPVPPLAEFEVREIAVLDWAIHICGLDVLQTKLFFGRKAGETMTDLFASWSNRNWTAAGLTSDVPAALRRWAAIVNGMEIRDVTAPGEAAISVAPTDPVEFVGRLLAEAQALLLAGDSLLGAGALDLPMRYFIYHAGPEPAKCIFTRSLLEVHATSPSAYTRLRDEIRSDTAYTATLNSLKPVRRMTVRNAFNKKAIEDQLQPVSADTMAWLAEESPARLDLLADFLKTAGGGVWSTWTEHRGNLSRYMVLHDYYARLFA